MELFGNTPADQPTELTHQSKRISCSPSNPPVDLTIPDSDMLQILECVSSRHAERPEKIVFVLIAVEIGMHNLVR
jgi:hypothetical protein